MNTIQTNSLSGFMLDYFVAMALGGKPVIEGQTVYVSTQWLATQIEVASNDELVPFAPSTSFDQGAQLIQVIGVDIRQYRQKPHSILEVRHYDASQGDEITYIESFKREMVRRPTAFNDNHGKWYAKRPSSDKMQSWYEWTPYLVRRDGFVRGETMLQAAMRWIVLDALGFTVEPPIV
ncbi:hypothetical protein [Shewanella marisflavi]|uniref:hypothetical protein n=1 Tax=Shewanella marisflavi TaxID=260364 RepID=UPI003AAE97FE